MAFQNFTITYLTGRQANGTIGTLTISGATPGNLLVVVIGRANSFGDFLGVPSGWSYGTAGSNSAAAIGAHFRVATGDSNDNFVSTADGGSHIICAFELGGVTTPTLRRDFAVDTDTTGPSSITVTGASVANLAEEPATFAAAIRQRWNSFDFTPGGSATDKIFSTRDGDGPQNTSRPGMFVYRRFDTSGTVDARPWNVSETPSTRNWLGAVTLSFKRIGTGAPTLKDLVVAAGDGTATPELVVSYS